MSKFETATHKVFKQKTCYAFVIGPTEVILICFLSSLCSTNIFGVYKTRMLAFTCTACFGFLEKSYIENRGLHEVMSGWAPLNGFNQLVLVVQICF